MNKFKQWIGVGTVAFAGLAGSSLSTQGSHASLLHFSGVGPAASPAAHSTRPDAEALDEYKRVIDNATPTIVMIKFLLKIEGGDFGGSNEIEMEVAGTLIDAKGLVLCSNTQIGGFFGMMGGGPTITPTDVKVLIGDDTEGRKAKVVTRDSELDLAWLQIEENVPTDLKFLDMNKGAAGVIGERVFLASKMGKFFDRALVINEGRLRGSVQKPRNLLVPSDSLISERNDLGMPVFNTKGEVLGIIILQVPDQESQEGMMDSEGGAMILPASEITKATKRALEAAANEPPKPDAPAADTKPAAPPEVPVPPGDKPAGENKP